VALRRLVDVDDTTAEWGRLAVLRDRSGHGFCLIESSARGYDAVAGPRKP
jgi:hypothetical protein